MFFLIISFLSILWTFIFCLRICDYYPNFKLRAGLLEGQEEIKQFLSLEFYLLIFKVLKCNFKVNLLSFSIFKWFWEGKNSKCSFGLCFFLASLCYWFSGFKIKKFLTLCHVTFFKLKRSLTICALTVVRI